MANEPVSVSEKVMPCCADCGGPALLKGMLCARCSIAGLAKLTEQSEPINEPIPKGTTANMGQAEPPTELEPMLRVYVKRLDTHGRTERMSQPRKGWCRVRYFMPNGGTRTMTVKIEDVEVKGRCLPIR